MVRRAIAVVSLCLAVLVVGAVTATAGQMPATAKTMAGTGLLDGLIAYWTLDEASGIRYDSSANEIDLSDNNGVASATGKIGLSARTSGGGTDYLSHPDVPALSPGSDDFTIALWVYLVNKPSTTWGYDSATIVNKWGSSNRREYNLVYRNLTTEAYDTVADTFEFAASADGTDPEGSERVVSLNAGPISTGQWYFIVAWQDSISDTLNIQVNNGTPNSISYTDGITDTTSLFELGRNEGNLTPGGSPLRFDGRIDELGLWSRVLTADERTALYNAGTGLTYPFGEEVPPTLTPTVTRTPTITPTPTQTTTATPDRRVRLPFIGNHPQPQWVTIKSEGFEAGFPNNWQVFDFGPGAGDYYWGARNCQAASGAQSGWAVGGGNGGLLSCGSNYPNDRESWMVYGPFDLSEASAADLKFKLNLYAELNYDGICYGASPNDLDYYGQCATGNSGGWIDRVIDLTNVPGYGDMRGDTTVWISFTFISDETITYPGGAFLDQIVLRKCINGLCPAAAAAFWPTPGPAQFSEYPVVLNRTGP